jgi:hypothetical protein
MRLASFFSRLTAPPIENEPYEPPQDLSQDVTTDEPSGSRGRDLPFALQEARRAARDRYQLIAEAMKREAGVRRHYKHKSISGLAWSDSRKILAPDGVTRRQLYVLAHECAHIVLHSSALTWSKPGHVKEHEAETYAHRAFARYGLEVPEKSAQWARAYVGQWIMRDRKAGIPICQMAESFASGLRAPNEPMPAVDGHPKHDFSKAVALHTAKSLKIAARQDAVDLEVSSTIQSNGPPNACGTCLYLRKKAKDYPYDYQCAAFLKDISKARYDQVLCNDGAGWRPQPDGFFSKLLRSHFSRR